MTKTEKLLRELIALPSVNPAFLQEGHARAGEQRVAEFLAATMAQAGLEVEFQEVFAERPLKRLKSSRPLSTTHMNVGVNESGLSATDMDLGVNESGIAGRSNLIARLCPRG